MDYFDDVFHTFLGIDSYLLGSEWDSHKVFIQNIFNYVPKMNKAFTGLEGHGRKWQHFHFLGGVAC